MKIMPTVLLAAAAAALTGCGGEGGDPPPPQHQQSVAISTANEAQVAQATAVGGVTIGMAGGAGASLDSGAAARASLVSASRFAREALAAAGGRRQSMADVRSRTATSPAPTVVVTKNCSGGGTRTFVVSGSDGLPDAGGTVIVGFSQCKESSGTSMDGSMTFTFSSATYGSSDTRLVASVKFEALKVVDGGVASTIDGSLSVSEDIADTRDETILTAGSDGIAVSVVSASYNDTVAFGADLRFDSIDDAVAGTSSLSVDGTMSSTALGGSVTLRTVAPLVQKDGDDFPSSGEVIVTGSNGSKLDMKVADKTQVTLSLDANGDGTYEVGTYLSWNSLIPQS